MQTLLKQIERTLFDGALNLPDPEVREAFLNQSCQGNPQLRARLEKLLASQTLTETFFEINPREAVAMEPPLPEAPEPEPEDDAGSDSEVGPLEGVNVRIGRYKLIRRLGEGGCGVVYMAEQQEPVQREVAIKIIRMGMDTESVIARFEMERRALALMSHPNIALVLDAGATSKGRPYFVMELVPGTRITGYCNEHRLGIANRLELFSQVCLAIQHAHQKGILHCDIKPSNVLITLTDGVPVPKVIDFGIGRAIEGPLAKGAPYTNSDQFIGTPAYMSPEQAASDGLDVDTRSDIYSLGALLYELLAGFPPFEVKQLMAGGVDEMRRILRECKPPAPSGLLLSLDKESQASVAAQRETGVSLLIARLRSDLDWIVMKAMEKDPQRRYATANGLAVDIQRYLHSQPVSAHPPSRFYWFRKMVRRNRITFVAAVAVTVALAAGLGTSTWLFFRERDARRREAQLRQEAEDGEKLTRAVFLVREGNFEDADKLLKQIKTPITRPSLDGVSAYRAMGEKMAVEGKWREAADQYSALVHIDGLDFWDPVTLDYQACGAALMECGDREGYARFCQAAILAFATNTNGDAASRILKSCLLQPPDAALLRQLRPLGDQSERWFAHQYPSMPSIGWAAIPISLWRYRTGDFQGAAASARQGLDNRDTTSVRAATLRLILAMSAARTGQMGEARSQLALGRAPIEAKFRGTLGPGDDPENRWYDLVFAHVLLREADALIPH